MKKIIGLFGVFLLVILLSNTKGASAYLFHSSQLCSSGAKAGAVKCLSYPTQTQCLNIGGNGTVLSTETSCVGGCNDAEYSLDTVGYCDQTASPSCPANCPGTYPSCVANPNYSYSSSNNTCNYSPGVTPGGTLTSNSNGVCSTTPGGSCTVSLTYSVNSGVTSASLWQCDKNGSNCSNVVSGITYSSIVPYFSQNITVQSFTSASQGSYVKLVNGASSAGTILADMYAAAIPQQSYSCANGTNYNRYTSGGTQTSSNPLTTYMASDYACGGDIGFAGVSCPSGTSGDTQQLTVVTPSRFACFTYDLSSCSCNPTFTCSAGTGAGGTTPSGTYPSCTCPGGQVYDSNNNTCACPAGQTWDSGTASCRSTCPSGSTGTYSPSCTCPSPASYSSGSNTCTCPAPRTWNGSGCVCPSGQVWDGSTCQIPCPSGTTGTYHPSCTCPAPRTYNTGSMSCQCPAGQTWTGTTCDTLPTRCNGTNGMYVEYTNITQTGFRVGWNCGTLTGSTYLWGPDQTNWSSAVDSGYYDSTGKSPNTSYNTSLWCGYPYGDAVYCPVTTLAASPITVTTNAASSITTTSASLSFTVSNYNSISVAGNIKLYQSNGTTVINTYPTTAPSGTVNANGTYSATVSSLSCGTTYQFRGEAGSTYGSNLSFTTSACPSMGVTVTNSPATTTYGQNVSLNYTVTNIPSGQTATCGLYDWTGNNAISGVSTQSIPSTSGSNTFTFNPSPSTLPVNSSGYGYVVKCSVPTPATNAQANATVYVAVDPTPTLTLGVTNGTPGQMSYQCNNSTGVLLKTTGGNVQSLTSGQYVYASATTPQTLVDLYSAKFKYDTQTQSAQPLVQNNFFFDRTNNGIINGTDVTYVNVRPLNVTVSASFFLTATGPQGYGVLIGPDGYMYVSDTNNDRILKINPNNASNVSVFHTSSGTPTGMVFDSAGNLYVSHYGLSRIVKITPGGVMTTFVPSISRPIGLAFDNTGNLFVTRQTDGIVNKVTPAGVVSTFASGLGNVNGIVINPNNNYVYVASQDTGNVYQITPAGAVSTYASGFSQPIGLTMDRTTSIYVSGLASGNISKIAPGGAVTTVVSGLTNPNGMAITSTGNMFIGLYSGQIYKTTILDTFPQTITGSFPVVQGATYALDCYGSFGTLPATTTYKAVDLNVSYASSTAVYPGVMSSCPSDSTSYTVTRSPSWSSAPAWASGPIWGQQYDNLVTSGSATTTYNYTLSCYKNSGDVYTGQVTNSINVPPAVTVTSLNAPVVASGTTATVTWKSDGNSCDLKNYNGSATWAGGLSGTPITGGYQYTYVMSPNNPNFTWLKSSRMGVNAVGWMVTCKDTTQGARLPASASSNVQVFNPTTATIIPPDVNGNLVFKCTPDFDYMDIKRNNTSLSGYPKTWNTNQTSNYSVTLPNLGGIYELVCKSSDAPGNIDTAIYPGTGLQVYGSIGGSAASIPTTAVVTGTTAQTSSITTDGTFSRLNYVIANATTWSVNYYTTSSGGTPVYTCTQAGGCDSAYSAYRLNSGSSEVNLYSSAGLPNTPFTTGSRWVITASDGVSTKTLTLILTQPVSDPNGSITVVPNPAAGVDAYNFILRCENSQYYNLYNMSYATTTSQGKIVAYNSSVPNGGTLNTTVTYTAVNSNPSASSFPLRFECVGAPGTNTFVDTRNVPILSKSPANVQKFTVYPSTVLCGGGQVALAWKINNPRGKNCTITANTIKPVSSYPAGLQASVNAGVQAIKSKLDGSNITVRTGAQSQVGLSTTTAFSVVDSENNNTAEIPRIPLRDPTKFILSCYNDGATTTVTVEARTACQGEQ